jgi:hypothetical protein
VGNGAEVVFLPGERSAAEHIVQRLFHRPLEMWEYAGLAGALDNAKVEIGATGRRLYIELGDRVGGTYRAYYYVHRTCEKLVLMNEGFYILYRNLRNHGLGLSMFSRQVIATTLLGVHCIELIAGRRNDENGYYTWPRFGFEGVLPASVRRELPIGLDDARTVLDLMESERGRTWWLEHGTTIHAVFDLTLGSRSLDVLQRYQRMKRNSLRGTKRNLEISMAMSYGNAR